MGPISEPDASPQHIDGGRREKGVQLELFETTRACLPHLTGAHCLSHRPFDACTLCLLLPTCGRFLAFARCHESGVGRFLWASTQHFCGNRRTLLVQRTRPARRTRKAHSQTGVSVSIRNLEPLSAGVPSRTDDLPGWPIEEQLALIEASSFS
jgi:hypothetical protein